MLFRTSATKTIYSHGPMSMLSKPQSPPKWTAIERMKRTRKKVNSSRSASQISAAIEPGSIRLKYFEEPLLAFGSGGLHVDPKAGVARYGPHSLGTSRHPSSIRIGMIGTAGTCGAAQGVASRDSRRGDRQRQASGVSRNPERPWLFRKFGFWMNGRWN